MSAECVCFITVTDFCWLVQYPLNYLVQQPHFKDVEWKLQPGMTTLTWTSLNIDPFINNVHIGLKKLQELVSCINDIIENRIEKNLKIVS